MRIINYRNDDSCPDSLTALISENYQQYPQYVLSRTSAVARALSPANPFFRYGYYEGFLAFSGGRPMANACAIIDSRLPGVGLIGFFESRNESIYARSVLREAVAHLASRRVTSIRGPIDLTTWNGFRLSFPDEEPPFVSEPFTPARYRSFFRNLGFSVAQRNISTFHKTDQVGFDRFQKHLERLGESGFVFERVHEKQLSEVLPQLHRLVIDCFDDTWSFVPISFEEFLYTFTDVTQTINEILLYIAYSETRKPLGFCLGALDWRCNGQRAVIKSVAAVPMRQRLEAARALLYCLYRDAAELRISEFILSTMRDDNKGVRTLISGLRPIYRQYEVYELNFGRSGL